MHCVFCRHQVDFLEGYAHFRKDGETAHVCANCIPTWIAGGFSGPAGISAAERPYWKSLPLRIAKMFIQRRFPARVGALWG
jgi:hypothetical protein